MESFLKKYWWAILLVWILFFGGMTTITGLIGGVTGSTAAKAA